MAFEFGEWWPTLTNSFSLRLSDRPKSSRGNVSVYSEVRQFSVMRWLLAATSWSILKLSLKNPRDPDTSKAATWRYLGIIPLKQCLNVSGTPCFPLKSMDSTNHKEQVRRCNGQHQEHNQTKRVQGSDFLGILRTFPNSSCLLFSGPYIGSLKLKTQHRSPHPKQSPFCAALMWQPAAQSDSKKAPRAPSAL